MRCDAVAEGCRCRNGRVQTSGDESIGDIARRYNVDDLKLACLNKVEHPCIMPASKLESGTLILLPLHPSLEQRMHDHIQERTELVDLPELASSRKGAAADDSEGVVAASVEFARAHGRLGTRCGPKRRLLYGYEAVRSGACEEWLGARVAVECVDSRLLGTVSGFEPESSRYHILLDAHGATGGIGDVAIRPFVVSTKLPSCDVQVVAAMPVWSTLAESKTENDGASCQEDHQLGSVSMSANGAAWMNPAQDSPDTPQLPVQVEAAGSGIGSDQLASLVGLAVTRPFDGVAGTVSTLVPGSDVVIIEWQDGTVSRVLSACLFCILWPGEPLGSPQADVICLA